MLPAGWQAICAACKSGLQCSSLLGRSHYGRYRTGCAEQTESNFRLSPVQARSQLHLCVAAPPTVAHPRTLLCCPMSHPPLAGLPEEVSHTKQALSAGYAVAAINSLDRRQEGTDVMCFS